MLIRREQYLQELRKLKDHNLIKVITGLRRSGKSTLLELFKEELLDGGVVPGQIQFLNFEDPEVNKNLDWRSLYEQIMANLTTKTMNYVFLDEIQVVPEFEKLVDGLFMHKNIDVYITGSNAMLLSGELATLLTGRYISINVLPLSFEEYCELFPNTPKSDLFGQYLSSSSLPEAAHLHQDAPELINKYLLDVYNTIVIKDIRKRNDIRDMANFEKVFKYVLGNVGSYLSARNIANMLNSELQNNQTAISHHTVNTYLGYLTETFLLYKADRYDIKGKNVLKTQDKYYVVDLGLRSALTSGRVDADLGHKLENLVYLELRRRNIGNIWVGKHENGEIDFVVQNPAGVREYYQVAWTVSEAKTLERELKTFTKINDNFPKMIITTDLGNSTIEGILKINIIDWLLGGKA